jgi:hypothetical protein
VETTKVKIALFQTQYGSQDVDKIREKPIDGWTQISKPVEVEFEPFSQEEMIQSRLTSIRAQRESLMAAMYSLDCQEQELLALEHIEP